MCEKASITEEALSVDLISAPKKIDLLKWILLSIVVNDTSFQ